MTRGIMDRGPSHELLEDLASRMPPGNATSLQFLLSHDGAPRMGGAKITRLACDTGLLLASVEIQLSFQVPEALTGSSPLLLEATERDG